MKVDLTEIVEDVFRMQTNNICLRFREAALIFTERELDEITKSEVINRTNALLYKFTLAIINLEFLWKILDHKNDALPREKEQETFEWNNSSSIMDSTFLESSIIQIRAFIDFAQRLSCSVLGHHAQVRKTKGFYNILKRSENDKSTQIESKFREVDETWGATVRPLRDKVVHNDIIKTDHSFRPTIQDKSYEVFAQELSNDMFEFLISLCETLFDIEWVSGTLEEFKSKNRP